MKVFFGFDDKEFNRTLFRLALPMMLQQLIMSSISLLDNMMIGSLGDNALAALLQASQISFLLFVFLFGITSATQAFTAQFWGQNDIASIRKTQGFSILCGQVVSVGFFLGAFFAPGPILSLFTRDPAVHALGVDYLRIVSFGFPLIGMTYVNAAVLRGTENVKLPMISSIIGICSNGILNYLLIFGHAGFPRLGVKGAAIATVIAQGVDLSVQLLLSYRHKVPTVRREYPLFRFEKPFIKRFSDIAIPVFLNESLWSLAQSTTILVYSWLGTQMAAAMGVFGNLDRLGFIAYIGIGNACAVICGKSIGAGDREKAQLYARRSLRIAPLMGIIAGIIINLLVPFFLTFYRLSPEALAIVHNNARIYLLLAPVMVYNFVVIVGILRSGGDARYSLLLDAGLQWALVVVGVAVAAFVLRVPLVWVYAFVIPGELAKLILGRRRVLSRQWINNLTE
jgi:putative MATE family efflux protein